MLNGLLFIYVCEGYFRIVARYKQRKVAPVTIHLGSIMELEINRHIATERRKIWASIKDLKLIYLDVNFWIRLRDEDLNRHKDQSFLNLARELVKTKKCLFPISEITFWEVLKQHDDKTVKTTLDLIEELSGGVSLILEAERRMFEFSHFYRAKSEQDVYELQELVWESLPISLGYKYLFSIQDLKGQKSFYDLLKTVKLVELVNILDQNRIRKPFKHKDDIEKLNLNKEKFKNDYRSFKQLFEIELKGFIDLHKNSIMESIWFLNNNNSNYLSDEKIENEADIYINELCTGIANGQISKELPYYRIIPALHSMVRWNKEQKFEENHSMDFLHASFALPYCDFFFTERQLCTMIIQLKLDTLYSCKIHKNIATIIVELKNIKSL